MGEGKSFFMEQIPLIEGIGNGKIERVVMARIPI